MVLSTNAYASGSEGGIGSSNYIISITPISENLNKVCYKTTESENENITCVVVEK